MILNDSGIYMVSAHRLGRSSWVTRLESDIFRPSKLHLVVSMMAFKFQKIGFSLVKRLLDHRLKT